MYFVAVWGCRRLPSDTIDVPDQARPQSSGGNSGWRDRRYLALAGLQGLFVTNYSLLETGVPIWVVTQTEAPPVIVSGVLLVNTLVVIFFQVRLSQGLEEPKAAARAFAAAGFLAAAGCGAYLLTASLSAVAAVIILLLAVFVQSLGEVLFAGGGLLDELRTCGPWPCRLIPRHLRCRVGAGTDVGASRRNGSHHFWVCRMDPVGDGVSRYRPRRLEVGETGGIHVRCH